MSISGLFKGAFADLTVPPRENVPALDVLRSLAILLVFTDHFSGEFPVPEKWTRNPLIYYGWSGVDLFFVLSGYLIGSQLWKEFRKEGRIRIGRFLLRRGFRIWPLYFSFLLLLVAEVVFAGRSSSGLLADLTFLSNYFHCQIGGGWSLSTEEQFYILAPISISLLALKLPGRALWVVPAAGFAATAISRAVIVASSSLPSEALKKMLYLPAHTHSDGLAVGLLIAWIVVFRPSLLTSKGCWLAGLAIMVIAGALLYKINPIIFDYSALGLFYGAAVWFVIRPAKPRGIVGGRGFYVLSRLSYGVYLNHFGLLPRLRTFLGYATPNRGSSAASLASSYFICLGASVLFAAGTFFLIEHPFLMLRSRWLSRMKQRQPAVA